MFLQCKTCYTSWNVWSKLCRMWSILLCIFALYKVLHCKTCIRAEICGASCLKWGAFCFAIHVNLYLEFLGMIIFKNIIEICQLQTSLLLTACGYAVWSHLAISELQFSAASPLWFCHQVALLPSCIEFNCLPSAAVGKSAGLLILLAWYCLASLYGKWHLHSCANIIEVAMWQTASYSLNCTMFQCGGMPDATDT